MRTRTESDRTSWMTTSLLLWLCTLPLIGVLVLPWFGARAALIAAVGLLAAAVMACYWVCAWQVVVSGKGGNDD